MYKKPDKDPGTLDEWLLRATNYLYNTSEEPIKNRRHATWLALGTRCLSKLLPYHPYQLNGVNAVSATVERLSENGHILLAQIACNGLTSFINNHPSSDEDGTIFQVFKEALDNYRPAEGKIRRKCAKRLAEIVDTLE